MGKTLKWMINNKCNLKCPYCLVEDNTKELFFVDKLDIIDNAKDLGITHIDFFGKEPLYDETIFNLMAKYEKEFSYSFITNGVNLIKYKEKIIDNLSIIQFCVSYDGGFGERSFTIDLEELVPFTEAGIEVELTIDIHNKTLDNLDSILSKINKFNFSFINLNPILDFEGRGKEYLDIKKFEKVVDELLVSYRGNNDLMLSIPFGIPRLFKKYVGSINSRIYFFREECCTAGETEIFLDPLGNLYKCSNIYFKGKSSNINIITSPNKDIKNFIKSTKRGKRLCQEY